VFPSETKGVPFNLGWWYHPGLAGVNHYSKIDVWCLLLVSVGNTNRDLGGRGSCSYFGLRRQKTFSPGSKVEPGLKGRTKGSDFTSERCSGGWARWLGLGARVWYQVLVDSPDWSQIVSSSHLGSLHHGRCIISQYLRRLLRRTSCTFTMHCCSQSFFFNSVHSEVESDSVIDTLHYQKKSSAMRRRHLKVLRKIHYETL
jgi:hypothetical protein